MLPDLPQIEAAFEPIFARWALEAPQQGTLVVVFSSVSPVDVRAFGERVAQASRGAASVVDAPVSGGQRGAIRGTLSIMVGAEPAQAEALAGLFAPLASTVVRLGPLGSGSLAKACNQLVVGATAAAVAEAAVLAETAGLDVGQLFAVLGGGLAGSRVLDQLGPRIVARDYTVTGPARFMAKDLRFVEAAAHDGGARLPLAAAALDVYAREPLPADSPLWTDGRILATPHIAAIPDPDTAARQLLDNLTRARRGEPLANVVDRERGY
jgi:2-hydroxy-3-oxopropionate reductase